MRFQKQVDCPRSFRDGRTLRWVHFPLPAPHISPRSLTSGNKRQSASKRVFFPFSVLFLYFFSCIPPAVPFPSIFFTLFWLHVILTSVLGAGLWEAAILASSFLMPAALSHLLTVSDSSLPSAWDAWLLFQNICSEHMPKSTNEHISKWNTKLMSLPPSLFEKSVIHFVL